VPVAAAGVTDALSWTEPPAVDELAGVDVSVVVVPIGDGVG